VTGPGAQMIGDVAVKLAGAALDARSRGDEAEAASLAKRAADALALAKALGWKPGTKPAASAEGR